MPLYRPIATACALGALVATSACSLTESNSTAAKDSSGVISVKSSDDACTLSATTAPSGRVAFKVENTGSKVTEFYLYDEAGTKIVAEVENIGPGLTRELVITAAPATYLTACKPGMSGKGIRADFVVTDSGDKVAVKGLDQGDVDASVSAYETYVQGETAELVTSTREFVETYLAGDDAQARSLYAPARAHFERIEPVAESFGDLDPKMDLREADVEPGAEWTGWHRLEKDLWSPSGAQRLSKADRTKYAEDLLANTEELDKRVASLDLRLDQIGNGAKGLLDEVASTKITGEEEIFSHTDLWDIEANVEGAKEAFEAVEDLLKVKDAKLYETIEEEFKALESRLESLRASGGFESYEKVTSTQRKQLSDEVNALAEPLSKMTGAILS
ncbi:MAG: iron uptake system protein EfeO [Marmoricola sp.]